MRCNSKIHVIKDESLGGVKREYIEVDRKAKVGDKVTYVYNGKRDGIISTVSKVKDDGGVYIEEYYLDAGFDEVYGFSDDAYRVLDPSDIVHIDGERFRMVDRKAEVGEHILIDTDDVDFDNGSVMTVSDEDRWEDGSGISVNESRNGLYHEEYYVLVPVESESSPQSTDDIIANLVRRVSDLERQTTELEKDNERQAWKIVDLERDYGGVKDDIETWAQEVETLRYTNTELYSRLGHVEQDTDDLDEKVEMCIDDIVTLDERTREAQTITLDVETFTKIIGGVR